METPGELFHFSDNIDISNGCTTYMSSYTSCIKIKGKPILPPLMTDEKRAESKQYRQKALQVEKRLDVKRKIQQPSRATSISSDDFSITNVAPHRQSTPARPASLSLGKTFEPHNMNFTVSSQQSTKQLRTTLEHRLAMEEDLIARSRRSPLDHRLASEDDVILRSRRSPLEHRLMEDDVSARNRRNKPKQSPILEEKYPVAADESEEEKKERKRWSPLKVDSLNSLRIEMPSKEDDTSREENTTPSPNLIRQNSYTLLTPSPALINFLEAQNTQRSHSGRKTWDLSKAKKNWDPMCKSMDETHLSDDSELNLLSKNNSTSLESVSGLHRDEGSTSSASSNRIKCKIKTKKSKSKNMPSPRAAVQVPCKNGQGGQAVPRELSDLSKLMMRMKEEHERQKRELEEKQRQELKELEAALRRREADVLAKLSHIPRSRNIYSQPPGFRNYPDMDTRMTGDGNHNSSEHSNLLFHSHSLDLHPRRPQSAKDFHPQVHSLRSPGRRTRSMDLNQSTGTQDTDLDVSFHEDSTLSKGGTHGNEDLESDSVSNLSSRSSTLSSETRQETAPFLALKQLQMGMSSEELTKCNQAATLITAAARGFLTRRLLRTAHVQGLITTLRDAISCATELHNAADLGDSDVDLMRRLGRQIEAAWEAVYSVFFNTEVSERLQLISADRERLRSLTSRLSTPDTQKRISSATEKTLQRKRNPSSLMSRSQTSNGCGKVRTCCKMTASYPGPLTRHKLK